MLLYNVQYASVLDVYTPFHCYAAMNQIVFYMRDPVVLNALTAKVLVRLTHNTFHLVFQTKICGVLN